MLRLNCDDGDGMPGVSSVLAERAHKKEAALWPGALPCSRSAHSGLFVAALEDRVLARRAQSQAAPATRCWRKPGVEVCRGPVALEDATGDDARSGSQPSHSRDRGPLWRVREW